MDEAPLTMSPAHVAGIFERFASWAAAWTGSTLAFVLAMSSILLWTALGSHFRWSDTWLLLVNTVTTIVTFLMVFVIQRSQNREMMGLKIQLGELISSIKEANNSLIDLDHLSEQQLEELHRTYQVISRLNDPASKRGPPARRAGAPSAGEPPLAAERAV
jgi:low affinity Fe/Cu permease